MKKMITGIAIMLCFLCFGRAHAQISISLNLNIDSQPDWGPTGYNNVTYYYLPDIDCYYYVPKHRFIYFNGSAWIWSPSLPPQYSNYDLYSGYKVVINGHRPYLQDNVYRVRYASYKGRRGQSIIRDSHDPRYHHGNDHNNSRPPVNRPTPPPSHQQPAQHNNPPSPPAHTTPAPEHHNGNDRQPKPAGHHDAPAKHDQDGHHS